jgi:tetratricopeptide (TPR) repeat protein
MSLARYLELFGQRRADLLTRGTPLAYHGSVDATFTLALDELQAADPAAAQLVELCALLAPDEIPLPLLLSQPALLPEPLATAAADRLRRGEVAGMAYQAGLLAHGASGARMHRLVQAVTLAHLPRLDRHQRTAEAVELLAELFPSQPWEPDQWPGCARLLAHTHAVTDHAGTLQLESPALALVLLRTGTYAHARGLLPLARALHEQALAVHQRLHRGDHPHVATSLSNLASDLAQAGEHERARLLDEQALAMRQRLYDGDHAAVAGSLGNLAVDLRELGEYERARALDGQALAMRRRLYDSDHLDLVLSLGNLATDLRELGEHQGARQLHERALAMCQRLYDGDHPAVAEGLANLAVDLRQAGECEPAWALDEQALAMRQRLLAL